MINRLVPLGIVIFRYIMVCKAILAFKMGEKALTQIVYKFTVWVPLLFGVVTLFHLWKIRLFCLCMGGEEQFLYQTTDFFVDSSFGSAFKLPFMDPFRLSFNITAFSFIVVVPVFYYLIYQFRESHTSTVQGRNKKI